MKISGFTIVRHGVRFDYPFMESLRSLLPLVNELIVNVGKGDDETLARIQRFAETEGDGKVQWFESEWPLNDPEKKRGGQILAEQTNLALDRCTGDWCVYLQADEVLHEADIPQIRRAMETVGRRAGVDGLLFDYVHFYGSFDVVQKSRSAYRREVRAVKMASDPRSVGDAQSFRRQDGHKLVVARSGARIYHYGWVRPPETMREKTFFMDTLYHGEPGKTAAREGIPHTGDAYRYKRICGLQRFHGPHPAVMNERIASKGWTWDVEKAPLEWRFGDIKKVLLDTVERLTGVRLFEYRNYRLAAERTGKRRGVRGAKARSAGTAVAQQWPRATLILSTYEMPRALTMVCAALERQTVTDFEAMICDDGSGPATTAVIRDFVERAPFTVKHLRQDDQGFRKCRILNEALRQARGDTVIFLDGDCIPHRHFIRDHLEQQESGRYLAGRRVELGSKLSRWLTVDAVANGFFDYPHPMLLLSVLLRDSRHLQRSLRLPWSWLRKNIGMTRVDDMKGCNYSVARKAFEELNGFDEDYEGYGREDTDVELRLQNLGFKIKSLKGLALQFHLWHPRRQFTPGNDQRLEDLKRDKRVGCRNGLRTKRS